MKLKIYYILILFLPLSQSCYLLKKSRDKSITKFATKNTEKIKEAATIAISIAFSEKKSYFYISQITDSAVKKKFRELGNSINVTFQDNGHDEIPDSCVTFTTITLLGTTEIVYDFAASDRNFKEKRDNRREYYFIKVANRIYYRRRPIPLM